MARAAGLSHPRGQRPVNRSAIHKILCNRIYCGEFVWKGKVYSGVHVPLVTRELWEKVQTMLRSRGVRKPRRVKHNFAFSGLITCGHCGCALVGEIHKGRYIYYHCTGGKGKCQEPYVREEVLEQKFTELLRRLSTRRCWRGPWRPFGRAWRMKAGSMKTQ
jgi:site-specific DNA recombinase